MRYVGDVIPFARVLAAGSVIAGKYRLDSPIGKGGMGAVWRATHLALGRAVAVKLVLASLDDTHGASKEQIERFLREARSAAAVRHRNVVDVLDFGEHEQRPFLVMECLEGESLAQRLERAPAPSLAEIVEWISGALGGLAAIHDEGLVHRDLKPANLFLARDADGVITKVLDFGIARQTEGGEGSTITHSMQTLGTPHYMSPEQVRSAKSVDARSDLYAMGVILYQALAGRLPFDGPSATAVIAAIVTDDPPRLASLRPDLPRPLSELVHRAMARDPQQRFADARTMRQALVRAAHGITPESQGIPLADASAATVPMSSLPGAMTPPASPIPLRSRTGRRGFLGIFGVLSTLLVVGLAGTWATTIGRSPPGDELALAPAAATTAPQPLAPSAPGGAALPITAPGPAGATAVEGMAATGAIPGAAISPALDLVPLALRIRELPDDLRGCARVVRAGERWAAIARDACVDRRDALARTLAQGEPLAALDDAAGVASSLEPVLFRTTTRANVREGASGASGVRRSVPDDALVVGLVGELDGTRSEASGRGTWTRAIAAEGSEGWIATGLLRPWEGCVPATDAIGGTRVIASATRVHDGSRETAGFLLFEPEAGSVRVVRSDARCALADGFDLPRTRAPVVDLFVTRVAPDGESLVLLGTQDPAAHDGSMAWTAYRLGAAEPSWTIELRTDANLADDVRDGIAGPYTEGPGGEPGHWPLRTRTGRARTWWRWDGATLAPDHVDPGTGRRARD